MSNLYLTSLSGLRAQQLRLDAVANNIANLGTTGFKTQRIDLTDLRAAPLQVARAGSPPAEATEIQEGVAAAGTTRIFSQGPL
ncbi:MAG: flagellar hook-basal body protein, partial [Thermomicrobiaceae bacterium]|nr:flagellar hook-basal body protein [Thermomicrobiaceae bacterium]